MYIDPHQSESQIRFSRMRKKNQQQRNEQLASENYLPNTFSLIMYVLHKRVDLCNSSKCNLLP